MVYLTLFFIAFLSGSLLPLGSEALFLYDLQAGYSAVALVLFASVGNILGALLNYYLGLKGEEFLLRKGYLKEASLQKARRRFDRFGGYILLLSAVPIIGDPLTFIAGVLGYRLRYFLFFVALSKTIRYAALALLFMWS